ncbi:MAG: Polyketide cyclase/dehydrase, partial [Gemmatimonadetes bacterium]|nr:Polyketide cyclase/dehydrase [Gemmatimonadota bacterium]
MKWLAIVLGVIAALALIVVIVGAMLPQSHVAVSSAQFSKPAADMFRTITDVATAASWRKDVDRIEMLPPNGNRIAWREVSKGDVVNYEGEIVRAPEPGVPGR